MATSSITIYCNLTSSRQGHIAPNLLKCSNKQEIACFISFYDQNVFTFLAPSYVKGSRPFKGLWPSSATVTLSPVDTQSLHLNEVLITPIVSI